MTEAEWLSCSDPQAMLAVLQMPEIGTERKLRLFACACVRMIWDILPTESCKHAIDITEQVVDGAIDESERLRAADVVLDWASAYASRRARDTLDGKPDAVEHAALASYCAAAYATVNANATSHDAAKAEDGGLGRATQAHFLRDIFGNPFRPVSFHPSWLASTVLLLAQGIYEEKAFDRMPILADALEDAGCNTSEILNHCRDEEQVHVRGCWVVDAVLGRS